MGDLNADGSNDIGVVKNGSHIWVIHGQADVASSGAVHVPDAPGQKMFQADASDAVITFRGVGNINNDGIDDLASGVTYGVHHPTLADLGKVEVFFGRRMGDVDLDADIDLTDFQYRTMCMTGPTDDEALFTGCQVLDFNHDGRVDLFDFGGFQVAFEE